MKQNEGILNRKVSVKSLGAMIGGTLLMAVATGAFWHRRAIKRMIEIRQM